MSYHYYSTKVTEIINKNNKSDSVKQQKITNSNTKTPEAYSQHKVMLREKYAGLEFSGNTKEVPNQAYRIFISWRLNAVGLMVADQC